jgi:ABC-type transporter Mla MlaB component
MEQTARLPLHVQVTGGELVIVLEKAFEQWSERWSPVIVARYPGPYQSVRIDCSRCNRLTSAFFAGAIHLRQTYAASGKVILDHLDPALLRVLATMRIDGLFTIIGR